MDKKVLLQDLADGVARKRNIPKKDAENFLRVVFDVIGEFLQTDKIVKVRGLGTFKLVTVDSRESVDVNTGERITIKEYTKVNFTPDPVLRDAVNKPFAQFETVVLYDGTKLEDMERMDFPELPEPEAAETGMVPSFEERPEADSPATENVEMENPENPDPEPPETPVEEEPSGGSGQQQNPGSKEDGAPQTGDTIPFAAGAAVILSCSVIVLCFKRKRAK